MPTEIPKGPTLKPLGVTCKSTNCKAGLHCFEKTQKETPPAARGRCIACGAQLIDWDRVQARDPADVKYTFDSLKFEMWRHHFWHIEIPLKAVNYARRKGRLGLQKAVERRLRSSVGTAFPFHDGFQTPREGSPNPIHYAQHATASCCRKCIEKWHGINPGRALTDPEIGYLRDLALLYIEDRLPLLTENGEKVPPIRRD